MKEEIMESFLSYGSKKVKKESLEEFLNSYKKEDLIRLAILPLVMDDNLNLNEIYNIKSSKKQEIIDYIKNNKESKNRL